MNNLTLLHYILAKYLVCNQDTRQDVLGIMQALEKDYKELEAFRDEKAKKE